MAEFKKAYEIGRVNEGGYANHPGDKGGETYSGVARNYWPKWEGWKIVDAVKAKRKLKTGEHISNDELEGMIFNFYRNNFWLKIHGDVIVDQNVANIFYDWTLTSGGAIKEVQEKLGVVADGKFGPKSVAALNALPGIEAFQLVKEARRAYYYDLVDKRPANRDFIKGWINRVDSFKYCV